MRRYGHLPLIGLAILLFGVAVFTAVADRTVALKLVQESETARRQGNFAAAERLSDEALKYARKQYGDESGRVAEVLETRGSLFTDERRYDMAEQEFIKARLLRANLYGVDSPEYGRVSEVLGTFYTDRARYAEAESCLQKALLVVETQNKNGIQKKEKEEPLANFIEVLRGPQDPEESRVLSELGWLYTKQGQYPQAETAYKRAMRIREKVLSSSHIALMKNVDDLKLLDSLQRKF